jgi:hypothetical protein
MTSKQHQVKFFRRSDRDHYFRCNCGESCPGQLTEQEASDKADAHLAYVDRVRKHLSGGNESLASAHAHYQRMAENTDLDPKDRELWEALANDTGRRLGIGLPPEKQEELFTLD